MALNPVFTILALILSFYGLGTLFLAWRKLVSRNKVMLVSSAWLALGLAMYCWVLASSIGVGVVLGALIPALFAWFCIMLNFALMAFSNNTGQRKTKNKKILSTEVTLKALPSIRSVSRNFFLFFLVVPFSAVTATFLAVFICELLPWLEINRMVLAVFVMPFFWGCIATWIIADPKIIRPVLISIAAALGSSFYLLGSV